jgi:hypothetical protein
MALDKESLITLICKHCEFYKESDKDLECGAYKILKNLMNFHFDGKSIRQEKDWGKEKSRAEGKGKRASSSPFRQELKGLLWAVGCMV